MFMTKREKWLIYGLMILATLVTANMSTLADFA